MMKIIISANNCWNVYNYRKELIIALLKRNEEVHILSKKDKYVEKILKLGCKFYEIKVDNHNFSIIDNLKTILSYYNAFKKIKPDVFLGFTIKPNIYGSLISYLYKVKSINTITGLGTSFLYSNIFIRFLVKILYKISLYKSKVVFFHNKYDEEFFIQKRIINTHQCKVVPGSGIDTNKFNYIPLKKKNNKPYIYLYVGRIIKDKGIYELIEASKMLKEKSYNFEIKIAGVVDNLNKSSISLDQIKEWHKEKLIDYIGYNNNIKKLIAESDCAVLPSYREGTSRFLLEAASIGRPIVCSDVPGCNNIVSDGINGFLFRYNDTNSIFQAMKKIYELSSEVKNNFGIKGREHIVKNFDVNIVIQKYMKYTLIK